MLMRTAQRVRQSPELTSNDEDVGHRSYSITFMSHQTLKLRSGSKIVPDTGDGLGVGNGDQPAGLSFMRVLTEVTPTMLHHHCDFVRCVVFINAFLFVHLLVYSSVRMFVST